MASTFSTNLRLELQGLGENRASWGTRANTVIQLLEEALAGKVNVTVPDLAPPYVLTHLDSQSDQSRPMMLIFGGALTADRTVHTQPVSKVYIVNNGTTGGKNVIFKTTTGSTQISLAPGVWKFVFTDGDKIYTNDNLVTFSSAAQRWSVTPSIDSAGRTDTGMAFDFHNANVDATDYAVRLETASTTTDLYITPSTGTKAGIAGKVWTANNMGAGSGLDADLLDGKTSTEIYTDAPSDGKYYLRRNGAWVAIDAPWTIDANGDVILRFAGAIKVRIRTDGYIRTASDIQIYSSTVVSGG